MESFYVTLPSNSSLDYFPKNTLTDYTTKLPQRLDLDESWEVALSEVQYTRSWTNVSGKEALLIEREERKTIHFPPFVTFAIGTLEDKVGNALQFLNTNIHKELKSLVLLFEFDPDTKSVQLNRVRLPNKTQISISASLAHFLGLEIKDKGKGDYRINKERKFKPLTATSLDPKYIIGGAWSLTLANPTTFHTSVLPEGFYKTPESIIDACNEAINSQVRDSSVYFTYNKLNKRVTIQFPDQQVKDELNVFSDDGNIDAVSTRNVRVLSVHANEQLGGLLGFQGDTLFDKTTTSTRVLSLERGCTLHNLYVYCDLVQDSVVGGCLVPILRVLRTQGEEGQSVSEIYQKPYYRPLGKRNFETIHTYILDETGERIPFTSGRVTLTLHFRRAR